MSIQCFGLDENEKWDGIVRSFDSYDVYYLSGYAKGFFLNGDGEPMLLYYEGDGQRAINVVMRRDVADAERLKGRVEPGKYYDFATPYGYGGWLCEGESDLSGLLDEYAKFSSEQKVVSEFVRFHPVLGNAILGEKMYGVEALGPTIALDLGSEDIIWENITSKNRNMIRKAIKAGIEIGHGSDPALYEIFREIYEETMARDNASPYYYFPWSMYETFWNELDGNAELFYATYDGETIAASIILFANDKMNYHLSGSRSEFRNLAPTNLLLFEAAKWGAARGLKTFHLGGGVGAREDGLFRFKKSFFRGEPCTYSIGKRVFDEGAYAALGRLSGSGEVEGFFPAYRG